MFIDFTQNNSWILNYSVYVLFFIIILLKIPFYVSYTYLKQFRHVKGTDIHETSVCRSK